MRDFETILANLKEVVKISNGDKEIGHKMADDILIEVALSTELTKRQREQLVNIYSLAEKWYA